MSACTVSSSYDATLSLTLKPASAAAARSDSDIRPCCSSWKQSPMILAKASLKPVFDLPLLLLCGDSNDKRKLPIQLKGSALASCADLLLSPITSISGSDGYRFSSNAMKAALLFMSEKRV